MKIVLMYPPTAEHERRLREIAPHVDFRVVPDEASARREVTDADAILGNRYFLQSLPAARRLRWMQSNSMGVDLILRGLPAPPSFILTSAKGVYDDEVAEHALALILGLTRGLHLARDHQHRRAWVREPLTTVAGRTAMILGWGGIGRAIGSRLRALGARVYGVARGAGPSSADPKILSPSTWRARLPGTDLLVMALPLTNETVHLVGPEELAALPSRAVLVNVGRGPTLDQAALLAALEAGSLAGAGLDVFEEEPLEAASPLWGEPRLIVTPHVGRSPEQGPWRWQTLFEENLRRFMAGEALLNVVDHERGY